MGSAIKGDELGTNEFVPLCRDEMGVEGAMGSVGSVGRGAGRLGTRKRPLPRDDLERRSFASAEVAVFSLSKKILEEGRVGVSWIEPNSVDGAGRLIPLVVVLRLELNKLASGPEKEVARRLEEGIITGDSSTD